MLAVILTPNIIDTPRIPGVPNSPIGFAIHPLYAGYALPFAYSGVNTFLQFSSVDASISSSFDVSDTVIYRYGYVSYDGQSWQQFNLTTNNAISGAWIYTKGTANVAFTPSQLRMSLSRNVSNNTYVVIYSCSRTTSNAWDCHDGWQIIKFDAKIGTSTTPIPIPSNVNTFYIDPNGVDTSSRNGSITAPWKSLSYACSQVTKSGSIIHVVAGTYTETLQCNLALGVNIEGDGDNSIIKSHITGSVYSNSFTIMLVSSSTTNGNQHISNIKMDGDSLTAYGAIYIEKRSNVEISHCTFVHFFYYGIGFEGGNTESGGFVYPPTIYPNNNSIHDCVIDDCSAYYPANEKVTGEGKGAIIVDGQEGMLIYNNILTQTSRPAGNNGYLIKGVTGLNKGLKIFNNTIVKAPYDRTTWDFAIELWLNRGGVEIYDNDITGSVDISGSSGELTAATQKTGSYTYGVYIHDNYIHQTNSESSEGIRGILIEQSAEDVIIAKNHITGVAEGIYCPLGYAGGSTFKNINISYNIIENLDGPNWQTWGMLIENPGGYTADNINIYNNVITARENGLTTMYGIEVPIVGTTTNVNIKNNIVEGFDHEPIYASGSSGQTLRYLSIENNIFYNNGNNNQPLFNGITPDPYTYTYKNNKEGVDPKFVDASNDDYHLQSNSPAINNGTYVGLTRDYDGKVVNNPPDIGAFEYP